MLRIRVGNWKKKHTEYPAVLGNFLSTNIVTPIQLAQHSIVGVDNLDYKIISYVMNIDDLWAIKPLITPLLGLI